MTFSDNIKKWVSIDDEIKALNNKLKEKREQRTCILRELINYKNNNNLDGKIIKYNSESFKFNIYRQYQTVTYDFIKKCLVEIINDMDYVEYVIKYIKEKRSYKNVEDIKRFYV
tara:strand:- start:6465 stop:6806 length:342 start_codon:yes stop_codon:yes gene_type:complete